MYGQCSQHCTNSKGSFKCSCEPGYHLLGTDKKTCRAIGNLLSSITVTVGPSSLIIAPLSNYKFILIFHFLEYEENNVNRNY